MRNADIQLMADDELKRTIAEIRDALRKARFSLAVGKLRQNDRYSMLRRDLARLLTEERSRRGEKKSLSA